MIHKVTPPQLDENKPMEEKISPHTFNSALSLILNMKLIIRKAQIVDVRKSEKVRGYTIYLMTVEAPWSNYGKRLNISWTIERRFREFVKFRKMLKQDLKSQKNNEVSLSLANLIKLPAKRILNQSRQVIDSRIAGLNKFCSSVLADNLLRRHVLLISFLSSSPANVQISFNKDYDLK